MTLGAPCLDSETWDVGCFHAGPAKSVISNPAVSISRTQDHALFSIYKEIANNAARYERR